MPVLWHGGGGLIQPNAARAKESPESLGFPG
jgi:hypothetical protein